MGKNIVVLGAGLVGRVMAYDLAKKHSVTSVDISEENLNQVGESINTIQSDISKEENIKELVKDADLVIGSVPGFMGFEMLANVIRCKKNIVDISFFPEDPFLLDELAKEHGVTAVMDCGVAPGMGNIILGYHNEKMNISDYECLVGGLPTKRDWPWEYKAVFSPIDVIEEYTRPARYIVNGEMVIREALSDEELIDFPGVGSLVSWNSDGLRSLMKTMDIPNMIEKTLRFPGTIEPLKVLRDTGYFSEEEIEINGTKIRPIDLTSKLLFSKWKLQEGETEFTAMRIRIKGTENGTAKNYQYLLLDHFDAENKITSMARTTGYTCTGVAELVLDGSYNHIGISPPEFVGKQEENFKFMIDYLKQRGVIYSVSNF